MITLHPDDRKTRIAKLEKQRQTLWTHNDGDPFTQAKIDALTNELVELRKQVPVKVGTFVRAK